MKKSYQKLIIFDVALIIILIINSLILSILGNYYYMDIFLLVLLILFRLIFGFEKGNHRYQKDIIMNIIIIYMASFIIYYIFGIFTGFYRAENYWVFYGIKTFIVPYIIMIILREYLRMQMLNKVEKSQILTIITCFIFILLEVSSVFGQTRLLNNSYSVFIFIALTILPIVSNNIVCTYIARHVGYKPNVLWLVIAGLYGVTLPIIPNVGQYIQALIKFLFPFVIMYNVYIFFKKREKDIPISYVKKRVYIELPILCLVVLGLAYFVSGLFRYYTIAIATGSMMPKIHIGDVVIVDQQKPYEELQIGEIIAYKYKSIVVVHRVQNIIKIGDKYYFYTKGDANENIDDYVIYPETIIGKVELKIPYIGLPTVWINDLLN